MEYSQATTFGSNNQKTSDPLGLGEGVGDFSKTDGGLQYRHEIGGIEKTHVEWLAFGVQTGYSHHRHDGEEINQDQDNQRRTHTPHRHPDDVIRLGILPASSGPSCGVSVSAEY